MMHRRIFSWLMLLSAMAAPVVGQTTGKLSGTIIDAESGEPLPGATVVIEGTTQGTATDARGEYVIVGVRPGRYTLIASFVGYASVRREGVRVNLDLTTTENFTLREQVFEGEEVVVTAEAEVVRRDITSSEARVTAETIDRLPVQEVSQVLNVQAGVTMRNNSLHIRGGRSSEVIVLVDGVPVTDSFDGSVAVELENQSIQELQVISGTFNAEHGNAMSGVINIVTKEGGSDRFRGTFEAFSGSYVVAGDGGDAALLGTQFDRYLRQGIPYRDADPYSFLDINPTQYYNLAGSLEGPLFTDRVTFFATGRLFRNEGWLYGARIFNMDGSFGDSSLVAMNNFEKYSWQGNLRFQLSKSMVLNLIGLGSREESRPFQHYWRWAPDGRTRNFDSGYDLKAKFTHFLGARTFYTLNVATFFREANSHRFDEPLAEQYWGNPFATGTPDSVEVLPGEYRPVLSGGLRFGRGGIDLGRFNRTTRSYFLKGDVTSQVSRNHLLKSGFEARLDRLSYLAYALVPDVDETGAVIEPFVPTIPPRQALGYQQFDGVEPLTVSGYVQDKMEFESFIVNAGLRLDFFDSRARVPADPSDPNIFNPFKAVNRYHDLNGDGVITVEEERPENAKTVDDREAYWWTDASAKFQISPRLGVAYPITEQGVVHFSYGHFLQIPTLNLMFQNFGYKIENRSGQYGPFGNPDLEAQRTVMYEIGLRQGIADMVVDVTGYYRDVRNWVSTSPLLVTELPGVTYVVYANRDYANTKGLTLSLSRPFADGYGFDGSYTFQVADGSNSDPSEEFFALQGNQQPTLALLPLSWDQRHKFAGSLYVGGASWGASLLGVWASGFPYTPSFSEAATAGPDVEPEFPTNSRRIPSTFQVDLTAYREFETGGVRPRVFVQVYNVFDRRNVLSVYSDTGRPDVTFDQPITSADPGFFVRAEHFAEPRRVHVGVALRF